MAERPDSVDPKVWEETLDWLFRLDRHPDDAAVRAAFDDWCRRDERHMRSFRQASAIWQAASALTPQTAQHWPAPAAPTRHVRLGRRRAAWLGALAAGLALFLVVGGWVDLLADHATAVGEQRVVQLSDGSHLRLNTDSAVRVVYAEGRRDVRLLRGEIFLDVAADPSRPFEVRAGAARVRVVGTHFGVRLMASGASVTVEEGRVAVRLDGQAVAGGLLSAGECVTVDFSERRMDRVVLPAGQPIAAWRDRRLIVERWSVAEVLDEIGRYYGGFILLRDEALAERLVNGVYDLGQPMDAVRAVAEAYGGRVTRITPFFMVVSAR